MSVKMILAVDRGGAIGWSDGRLPWKIPADMKRFKELTTGHTVIMGHNTFKSLNMKDGLPNRRNIVLSRKPYSELQGMTGDNVEIVSSFDWIIAHQKCLGCEDKVGDVWIIGGAQVYAEALKRKIVDEIYLTQVHTTSGGDVTLPEQLDMYNWKLFVIRQRAIDTNVNWDMDDIHQPTVVMPSPGITFLHFTKLK